MVFGKGKQKTPWNKGLKNWNRTYKNAGFQNGHKQFGHMFKKGNKNPAWEGGISYIEYPKQFYDIREKIRTRDKYMCQICGNKTNIVHHIDYNKQNSSLFNLICLCPSCHTRTNHNREYWQWQLGIFMQLFNTTGGHII